MSSTTYDWLKQYLDIQNDLAFYEFKLRQAQLELDRWKDGDLSQVHINKRSNSSRIEPTIIKLEKYIQEEKDLLSSLDKLVARFNGIEEQILHKKYIEGKTLEQIAEETNYSVSYVRKKHADIGKRIDFLDQYEDVLELNKTK